MIILEEVKTKKQLKQFINFPHELYRENTHYVPELNKSVKDMLTLKNPFFEHSRASLFLAVHEEKVQGRIAFIENCEHIRIYNQNICFFGFFDVVNDYEIAKSLLDKITSLAKELKYDSVTGPTNLTTNDSCGLLIKGFEEDPVFLMPYNFSYYIEMLKNYGFRSEMNLYSYQILAPEMTKFFERLLVRRMIQRLETKNVNVRESDFKDFKNEMLNLRSIYNESNKNNWGFVPLTGPEFEVMSKNLKMLIPPELVLFAMHNDRVIGFLVALPDFNFVFKRIKNGKLFPFGVIKLLWYKRRIKKARILILGVLQEFRGMGVDILLYSKITNNLIKFGVVEAEACYVMGNNKIMNSILNKMGGARIKEYSILKMELESQ